MTHVLLGFLILCLSVWAGLMAADDPGYIMATYQDWVLEAPLWFSLVVLLLLFFVMHVVLRCMHDLRNAFERLPAKWRVSATKRIWRKTCDGFLSLASADWANSEKALLKTLDKSEHQLLHYIALAHGSHGRRDKEKRAYYLQMAQKCTQDHLAIWLTKARFLLEDGAWQDAEQVLTKAYLKYPSHHFVLKHLKQVYAQLEKWQELLLLLPRLYKAGLISDNEKTVLTRDCYVSLWQNAMDDDADPMVMDNLWRQIPRYLQQDSHLIALYARYLQAHARHSEAELLLRRRIQKEWSNRLVELYGSIEDDVTKQLKCAEKWHQVQNNNPFMLSCLVQLNMRHGLWGQAKYHMDKMMSAHVLEPRHHQLLGDLYMKLDDPLQASQAYRQGLISTTK